MTFNMITMSILKNIIITENIRHIFFLNIFTIIILTWIYHTHDDFFTCGRSRENKDKRGSSLKICFKRYLAEFEGDTELYRTGFYENSPYYFENNGISKYEDDVSIYGNMKNSDSKKLKLYMIGYKHRYAKKKGLSKLDCYCEKILLDKFHHIYELAEKMKSDKKRLKRTFYKKYGTGLIFISLIPALGFIFPVLFGDQGLGRGIIRYCLSDQHKPDKTHANCSSTNNWYEHKSTIENIGYFSYIFFFIIGVIVLLFFIYILIKFIKYERLKAGRGKMNRKEYIDFCKTLLKN